jgi:putative hydrolase of the HAD superfamily
LCYGTNHAEARRFWLRVVTRVFEPGGLTTGQAQAILDVLYDRFGHAPAWRIEPTWPRVLAACRENGVKVGLISNWDVRLRALLDELGIPPQVDEVVISAECGVEKPAPAIFHAALKRLDVDSAETVHTGDSFDDDCEAARAVGMRAVWFNPQGAPLPDGAAADSPQVRQLAELLPLLGLDERGYGEA